MHLYQAYLKAAGLPPMDHRNRRVSGSHTFAASNRPPQRRQASVFSRAVAFVKAWAERRRGARELYALTLGLALLVGRLIHAFGVSQENETFRYRTAGMSLTFIAIAAASVMNLGWVAAHWV